jgi:hypothetical protein
VHIVPPLPGAMNAQTAASVLVQREMETGRSLLASIAISRAGVWTTLPKLNGVAGKPRC